MTKAVDMWSEVAVYAVTVYEGKVTIGRMYVLASKARHHSLSMRCHLALNIFYHTYSSSYNQRTYCTLYYIQYIVRYFVRTYTTYRYVIILPSSFTLSIYIYHMYHAISFLAHKLLNKIKEGRVVIPLSQLSVLKAIRKKMPPLLATPSDAFIPPALKLDPTMADTNPPPLIPLSAAAVVRVEEVITELFIRIGTSIQ